MTNEYRPFFNRKFLTGLMWFCLLAILVLSSMGPGDVEYNEIEANKAKTLYWMELDNQPTTLSFLLPTQTALNGQQRQLQQLKGLILQKRLHAISSPKYRFSIATKQDRIEINLQWAKGQQTPDLNQIWDALKQPIESQRWAEDLTTIQARQYLDTQTEDQKLINLFYTQLQPESNTDVLQQLPSAYLAMFATPRYAISGEDAADVAEQVAKTFPQERVLQATSLENTSLNTLRVANDSSKRYNLLLGGNISPRSSEAFIKERIAAQVLQDLLSNKQQALNLEFRILWSALESTGYRAIILSSNQNPGPALPQLQDEITESLVEKSQQHLALQWQERMREHINQVQAMNLIAFYGLAEETMESYTDWVKDQDTDEIAAYASQALQTDQQISILQPPAY